MRKSKSKRRSKGRSWRRTKSRRGAGGARSKKAAKSRQKHGSKARKPTSTRHNTSKRKHIKTFELPKTRSKEIASEPAHKIDLGRNRHDIAYDEMTLTQLQIMARNRGIPFGGLPREKLIHKINIYK
ncbi:hypothetical protein F-S17_0059 [Faustovirus]|nr:hypothetical protein F-S17_0059 [Faustovirus]